jgi:hypothetical protein
VVPENLDFLGSAIFRAIGGDGPLKWICPHHTVPEKQKPMDIKLQMYLFFYIALGLNDLDVGNSITWAIGRGGPSKQGH